MTAKIDGTNGLLQAYDYQTPSTGFSYTFPAGAQTLLMVPAATLATGTITMPAAPADGMMVTFSSSQQITALTLQGNTGQSISSAVTFLPAKAAAAYVYRLSNTTWYPTETVPGTGSQLVSGTSQTAPPPTPQYFDFTGIPSWVKRVTVMFNGVSTSGTSQILLQIGAGSVTTSGYVGGACQVSGTTISTNSSGFLITQATGAANTYSGSSVINNSTSNVWNETGTVARNDGTINLGGGFLALGGTLDRLRVTTVGGTDTFDAGSINILYE